jgi:hypothetical protein
MAEPTTTETEAPETEAPETVEEEQLTPAEQAEVDVWLASERGKWEEEYREKLREEIRGELEGEMDMKEFVAEVKAMKAELDELRGKQPKPRLSADHLGNRGPSAPPAKLKVSRAQLNDLNFMAANKGKLADVESWELADE